MKARVLISIVCGSVLRGVVAGGVIAGGFVACAKPNYAPDPAPRAVPGSPDAPAPGAPPKDPEAVPAPKPEACAARFSSKHCLNFTWELLPTEEETGVFTFRVSRPDPAGPVLEDPEGRMTVVAWMPSMGHGSSPITVERLDVGVYRASQVFFTMRGEWELRFLLKNGSETRDQAILPITF